LIDRQEAAGQQGIAAAGFEDLSSRVRIAGGAPDPRVTAQRNVSAAGGNWTIVAARTEPAIWRDGG